MNIWCWRLWRCQVIVLEAVQIMLVKGKAHMNIEEHDKFHDNSHEKKGKAHMNIEELETKERTVGGIKIFIGRHTSTLSSWRS
jgi:hypothetical protein